MASESKPMDIEEEVDEIDQEIKKPDEGQVAERELNYKRRPDAEDLKAPDVFSGFRKETLPIYRAVTLDTPTGMPSPVKTKKPVLPKEEKIDKPEKGTFERHILDNPNTKRYNYVQAVLELKSKIEGMPSGGKEEDTTISFDNKPKKPTVKPKPIAVKPKPVVAKPKKITDPDAWRSSYAHRDGENCDSLGCDYSNKPVPKELLGGISDKKDKEYIDSIMASRKRGTESSELAYKGRHYILVKPNPNKMKELRLRQAWIKAHPNSKEVRGGKINYPKRVKTKKSYAEELLDFSNKIRGDAGGDTAEVLPKRGARHRGRGKLEGGDPMSKILQGDTTLNPDGTTGGKKQSKRSQRNQNTAPQRAGTKKLVGGAMGNVRARIQTPIVIGAKGEKIKPSDKKPPQTRSGQQRSAKRRVKLEVVRRSFITFEKIDLDPFETSNESDPVGRGHGKKLPDKVNSKKLGVEKPTHKPSMPTIKPAKRVGTSTMGLGSGAGRPITQANNREWFSEVYGL